MKDRYLAILKSDFKYMFLVSCISADTNFTVEDRQENVSRLKICKEAMKEYNEDDKADIEDMINRGIELLEREIAAMLTL